jgi:tight adherence protein C
VSGFDLGALNAQIVALSVLFGWSVYLFVVGQPLGRPRPDLGERLKRLDVRERVRMRELGRFDRPPVFRNPLLEALLRPLIDGTGRSVAVLLSRLGPGGARELEGKLAVAQPGIDVAGYYGQQVLTGLVYVLLVGVVNLMVLRLAGDALGALPVWMYLLAFALGFIMPKIAMDRRLTTRRQKILLELPGVLEMLTIAMSAGRTPEESLSFVAHDGEGDVAREFRFMSREMAMTRAKLPQSLDAMAKRLGVPELSQLAAQVKAADELGVSIVDTLSVQAEALRERKRLEIVDAGNRASLKMVSIIALFIFPSLFVVLLLPAALRILGLGR